MIQQKKFSPHNLVWFGLIALAGLVAFPLHHGAPMTPAASARSTPPAMPAFAQASARYGVLIHAISLRNRLAVKAALDSGCDPNFMPSAPGWTGPLPLCMAAQTGDTAIVRILLDRGANMEASDRRYFTPLAAAVSAGKVNVVRYLISRGARVNDLPHGNGSTALWAAAVHGSAAAAAVLLAHGADPNTAIDPADPAYRVLDTAREYHNAAVASLLRSHGAKPLTGRRGRWRVRLASPPGAPGRDDFPV